MRPTKTLRLLMLTIIAAMSFFIADGCNDASETPADTSSGASPDTIVLPADTLKTQTDTVAPTDTTKGGQPAPPR